MIASERSDLSDLPSHLDHDAIDCINDVAGGQQREQYDTRGCFEVVPPSPQRRGEPTDCRHVGQAASQVAGLISLTLSGSVESSGQNDPAACRWRLQPWWSIGPNVCFLTPKRNTP
jgi:hypothetical protein